MKHLSKRLLSLLLCLVLCISWLPAAALAEEEPEAPIAEAATEAAPEEATEELTEEAPETAEPETPAADTEAPNQPEAPEEPVESEILAARTPAADTDLLADATWIPDENFRTAIKYELGVSTLTLAQAAEVEELDVSEWGISSLTGIAWFTGLEYLDCSKNSLTSLDVSKNTELKRLVCYANELASLNLSKNTALEVLDVGSNPLTGLNLSVNTALKYLDCGVCCLKSLDLSKNTALAYLVCFGNNLTSLNLSGCTALTELQCQENKLASLDLSENTALSLLDCGRNALTSIDLSANTSLKELEIWSNRLTSLDISSNTALESLECSDNSLISLDVSANTALHDINCSGNKLTSLDVSGCTELDSLHCSYNRLTRLELPADCDISIDSDSQTISLPGVILDEIFIGDLTTVFGELNGSEFSHSGFYGRITENGLLMDWIGDQLSVDGRCQFSFEYDNVGGEIIYTPTDTHSSIALQQSYLLLAPGESAQLLPELSGIATKLSGSVTVFVYGEETLSGDGVAEVIGDTVVGMSPGSVVLKCVVADDYFELFATDVRVDVTAGGSADVTAVSLQDTAVTANIYSKSYARIGILPELDMLSVALSEEEESAPTTAMVESAEFTDEKAKAAFTLRVIDDRTLELVPDETALAAGIKGTFNSQIAVTLKGREDPLVTSAELKLTVTNSKPTVKGSALSMNSLLKADYPITLIGAAVESISVASAPDWLYVDTVNRTATLIGNVPAKASGKLVLNCTLAEYALTVPVTIKVSVTRTEPKLKLSKSTVTLTAGGCYENISADITTPGFEEEELTISRITEGSGKSLVTYDSECCPYLRVSISGWFGFNDVKLFSGMDDGKNHTLKVYLSVAGKETPVTVKVNTAGKITLSAKATGTMDSTVNRSSTAITVTAKGLAGTWSAVCHWNEYGNFWDEREDVLIDVPIIVRPGELEGVVLPGIGIDDSDEDSLDSDSIRRSRIDCFAVARIEGIYTKSGKEYALYEGNGFRYNTEKDITEATESIPIYRNTAEALPKNTYYARVAFFTWVDEQEVFVRSAETYVKLNIAFPAKATAGKLKIKAVAKDYYLTGIVAEGSGTVTGIYTFSDLTLSTVRTHDAIVGKLPGPEDVTNWFSLNDEGKIELTDIGWAYVKPGDKYTFTLTCADNEGNPVPDATGNPVSCSFSITLKGGKVKATATGTATLLKKDRFDTTNMGISFTDADLNPDIAPELDAKSAELYDANWSYDTYGNVAGITLKWKDNTVAPTAASGIVKVNYWVLGNNNPGKPDTLTLMLTVK